VEIQTNCSHPRQEKTDRTCAKGTAVSYEQFPICISRPVFRYRSPSTRTCPLRCLHLPQLTNWKYVRLDQERKILRLLPNRETIFLCIHHPSQKVNMKWVLVVTVPDFSRNCASTLASKSAFRVKNPLLAKGAAGDKHSDDNSQIYDSLVDNEVGGSLIRTRSRAYPKYIPDT
jgi:hypothetical protein